MYLGKRQTVGVSILLPVVPLLLLVLTFFRRFRSVRFTPCFRLRKRVNTYGEGEGVEVTEMESNSPSSRSNASGTPGTPLSK